MLSVPAKLALIIATLVLFAPSADAQNTHPQCTKAKDKVKCTCFMTNGGQIIQRPGTTTRTAVLMTDGQAEGYYACMHRNGRPNG
jgi:hypothetical protein